MLQRLAKGAHRSNGADGNTPNGMQNNQGMFAVNAPEPPTVGKVDHHSIELFWEHDSDVHSGDKRVKFTLQEEDRRTKEYKTVYNGFADTYKIEGLDPLQKYTYCLQVSTSAGDISISPPITVCTTKEPYNSEQLHRSVLKGDKETLIKILESGDVNVDVTDKLGFTPLMNGSQKGFLDIVETLIAHRADVIMTNSIGKNSMMLACFSGHEAVARKLKEAGTAWDCTDRGGSTALHWAVDGANCHLIEWMIEDGAPVDIHDKASEWTPLMRCAALSGNVKVATVLIKAGSAIDAVDNKGNTPLMIAALNGHLALVELLVSSGANLLAKSKHGKTALEMAHSFDRRPVVKFLESAIEAMNEQRANTSDTSINI
uniref:Fibronectin type 3 and ankyrin repeat domains protein 1 n=1 Tax=Phallusia mammillata TaxID=59560 RepID=A0A6F9DCQ1_9ASCI|nr:fibronectin type 3 and ankyrin repeat domains protein 1 [Phallusia mammillata]